MKRRAVIGAIVATTILAAGGVGAYLVVDLGGGDDEAEIRQLVDQFALAVDAEDLATVTELLCEEEVAALVDDGDYDPDVQRVEVDPDTNYEVTDVRVADDVASAHFARPPDSGDTLYFRREAGSWSVCAPAASEFPAS